MTDPFDLAERLRAAGQEHLLARVDDLDPERRQAYLARLAEIDWLELAHPAGPVDIAAVGSSRIVTRPEQAERSGELLAAGEACYGAGGVAVLMVAGGQGTRLGFAGPKGCFELGVHSGKSIYQLQAEKIVALSQRIGQPVPFLVMTSPATDDETRTFFAAHERFGLEEEQLRFFRQGTAPSVDAEGRALLAEPGRLLENPDGHGGCFTALIDSGQLARLHAEGVRRLVYVQVDNVLAPFDDPMLVGLSEVEAADVVTKVLPKAHPDEKVGHLVRVAGRDRIVEYTELSAEDTRRTGPDGELVYRWGSPGMHCWGVAFLTGLADRGFVPPVHRSSKPLRAWVDGELREVAGFKNERFIFDLVPEAERSIGMEIDRAAEFAPVKNSSGADSAQSAQRIASELYAGWLRDAGATVDLGDDQLVEISPLFGATASQVRERWGERTQTISGDFYLEGADS